MVYKIFADTNVFLDHLLQRGENNASAEELFLLAEQQEIVVYTSTSSFINIIYVLKSQKMDFERIKETTQLLLSYIEIIDADKKTILQATHSGFKDQEDAIQYHTALFMKGINYFITSNIKDYRNAVKQLPVFTPLQFLQVLKKK